MFFFLFGCLFFFAKRYTHEKQFSIVVADRELVLSCESAEERDLWMHDFNRALSSPGGGPPRAVPFLSSLPSVTNANSSSREAVSEDQPNFVRPVTKRHQGYTQSMAAFDFAGVNDVTDVSSEPALSSLSGSSRLVHQGYLFKKADTNANAGWQKRYYVFSGKYLKYYSTEKVYTNQSAPPKAIYSMQHVSMVMHKLDPSGKTGGVFMLVFHTGERKQIQLRAKNEIEAEEWIYMLTTLNPSRIASSSSSNNSNSSTDPAAPLTTLAATALPLVSSNSFAIHRERENETKETKETEAPTRSTAPPLPSTPSSNTPSSSPNTMRRRRASNNPFDYVDNNGIEHSPHSEPSSPPPPSPSLLPPHSAAEADTVEQQPPSSVTRTHSPPRRSVSKLFSGGENGENDDELHTPLPHLQVMEGELKKRTTRAFNNTWQNRYFHTDNYYLRYRRMNETDWSSAIDLKTGEPSNDIVVSMFANVNGLKYSFFVLLFCCFVVLLCVLLCSLVG